MSKLVITAATRKVIIGTSSCCNWPQFHRSASVLGVTCVGLTTSDRKKMFYETQSFEYN